MLIPEERWAGPGQRLTDKNITINRMAEILETTPETVLNARRKIRRAWEEIDFGSIDLPSFAKELVISPPKTPGTTVNRRRVKQYGI